MLTDDGLKNIAGLGDVREINLCLEAAVILRLAGARRLGGTLHAGTAQGTAHLIRLEVFERTGVRLLLGDARLCQHIQNSFALDFQLSRQIVDSNLTHPPLCATRSAKSSCQPHGSGFVAFLL